MSEIVVREVELPCEVDEAWRHVADLGWLGDSAEVDSVPGGEGWVRDGDQTRYVVVEEVDESRRFVYRWASYTDAPSRVEIDLEPVAGGTRVSIVERPIEARAQASLALR
jgi:hypothetical protein